MRGVQLRRDVWFLIGEQCFVYIFFWISEYVGVLGVLWSWGCEGTEQVVVGLVKARLNCFVY